MLELAPETLFDTVIDHYQEIDFYYRDEHMAMVSKPADLLTVPGRGPDKADCLISRLQEQSPYARIVHRLDMATSGILVIAYTPTAHRELSRQFQDRETQKHYIAVINGDLVASQGTTSGEVDLPLITDWPNRPKQKICFESGKPSQTLWEVLENSSDRTRVKLTPITGRSHQLRVHMLALGHPIIGDNLYACEEALNKSDRLLLHAEQLTVKHPVTQQPICAKAVLNF
ncbi:pseudouridine synthase [Litoribrevibacter albus]|uniref:Dual-specificity RNA pseudouridine synthase RluA n=1 Tax=Litoribrevibacter albus TaxID=1473156 RepID=A0AA37W776_9GAMM|nr:pseudouridine synthase [Litoribrevibacter albus]